jgi:hypothetical protein
MQINQNTNQMALTRASNQSIQSTPPQLVNQTNIGIPDLLNPLITGHRMSLQSIFISVSVEDQVLPR